MPVIKIDGVGYDTEQLSKTARGYLVRLRRVDQKIRAAEQELDIFKAARNFYAGSLKTELGKVNRKNSPQ
ncbi:MAG: hypothetical protein JJ868_20105 [Shimia sp.]|uniref:DUF6447 family protein n=1 Tax=Shimia sp. TaxID=1954381 RepID=UPI001B0B6DDC|nr:DUF6447 family protein [Shimia sp.]MBO6899659.1 hypothetical protein [Shimia sp.]